MGEVTYQRVGQCHKCGEPTDKATRFVMLKRDGTSELQVQTFWCQGCIDRLAAEMHAAWRRQFVVGEPQDYRKFLNANPA